MTTIDQRILIPAPPVVVWEYLSKIENNPNWQVNCEQVIFLSQRRSGVGTRWRETHNSRQEFVYEVSTWYDTLGYEYEFVDGPTIQSSKGRIRLQEIPEGTIVQWTYIYEPGGVLGGIRNALTTQRRVEADMVESLKNLWKIVKRSGTLEGYEARSLMRDGPQSPQERAQYQSRYREDGQIESTESAAADLYTRLQAEEPPVSTEDTRPGKAAAQHTETEATPEPLTVPTDAPDDRFAPPAKTDSGTFAAVEPAATEPPVETKPESAPVPEPENPYAPPAGLPTMPEAPAPADMPPADAPVAASPPVEPSAPAVPTSDDAQPEASGDLAPKAPDGKDTSEMSIWEVFGIPSPTDSQRMRAIQAGEEAQREFEAEADTTAEPENTAEDPVVAATETTVDDATVPSREPVADSEDHVEIGDGRTGLRVNARKKMVRVRRPGK